MPLIALLTLAALFAAPPVKTVTTNTPRPAPVKTAAANASRPAPLPDTPFYQDYHEAYPLDSNAANDVLSIAVDRAGRVWIATADGVRYLDEGEWKAPAGGQELGLAYIVCPDPGGSVWVGAWSGLYKATPQVVQSAGLSGMAIDAVAIRRLGDKQTVYAGGAGGIWQSDGGDWKPLSGHWHKAIRALAPAQDGRLWIGTQSGLFLLDPTGVRPMEMLTKPDVLLSSTIYGLTTLADGSLAIANTGGVDLYAGTRRSSSLSSKQGMPNHFTRAVAQDADGRLWIATPLGVARYAGGSWSLRHSRRWLLSDDARSVAIGPDGTAWIATGAGVDAIRRKKMTLAAKADYFLSVLRARHIRPPGLVGPAVLDKPGDLSSSFIEDDDNDGQHTGEYLAVESMRYAVTQAPDARENARVAFHALLELQHATGTPHFFARSVVPADSPPRHEVDRTYTPQEIADLKLNSPREKPIEKRWLPSPDGKWLFKRDTSSDEVDGHMFGYATYYDLAADDDEKKLVAQQVDRIIGGIVDAGYKLVDVDGEGTEWGNWSPESLNDDPTWHEERSGNSIEIIAHLGVAYHVTHNERYRTAAKNLLDRYGYERNILSTRFDTPSERTHINDELLAMVFPDLMTHPLTPELQRAGQISMKQWHVTCARDHVPFYDFAFTRFSGAAAPIEPAVEILRDWPLDWIEWTVDNTGRDDVTRDTTPGGDPGLLARQLPRSEIGLSMWDQEPRRAVIGRGGDREEKPTDWLLSYWMGRYYGLIAAPAASPTK
jgi:hypothetical protein